MADYVMNVSTKGCSRAQVLCALYNAASPWTHHQEADATHVMTVVEAEQLLTSTQELSTVRGRELRIAFGDDPIIDVEVYEQFNGDHIGERAIAALHGSALVTCFQKGDRTREPITWLVTVNPDGRFETLKEHLEGKRIVYY